MRNLFIGIFSLLVINGYSQKITVKELPEGVKKTFEVTRSDAKNVEWSKDSATYIAKFTGDSGPIMLIYEMSGMLKTTRYTMDAQYVPAKIMEYVTKNYPKFKVKCFYEDITLGADTYHVEVAKKKELVHLKFQPDGTFLEIVK